MVTGLNWLELGASIGRRSITGPRARRAVDVAFAIVRNGTILNGAAKEVDDTAETGPP